MMKCIMFLLQKEFTRFTNRYLEFVHHCLSSFLSYYLRKEIYNIHVFFSYILSIIRVQQYKKKRKLLYYLYQKKGKYSFFFFFLNTYSLFKEKNQKKTKKIHPYKTKNQLSSYILKLFCYLKKIKKNNTETIIMIL